MRSQLPTIIRHHSDMILRVGLHSADGRDYTVDINVADDEHTAREVLVERLSKISNPNIIRNDPPVAGDISFTVAGQSVLFVRNNIAVTVFFGPQSKPLATAIDQQIMT